MRRLPQRLLDRAFDQARRIPGLRGLVERELDALLAPVAAQLRPYRGDLTTFRALPAEGVGREDAFEMVKRLSEREQGRWREGRVSGAVYHGDPAHVEFLNRVSALMSQSSPLHTDVWPSLSKFEAEIVAMTARMLGAPEATPEPDERICGTVTSGGTESILLAMKSYRDRARAERKLDRAEIVVPDSSHAAFDKAAALLGMEIVRVPVGSDYRADVPSMRRALTRRTVVVVGSAPCFPHGVIDPVDRLSELALERHVGLHVDACLGGFVLPWARELGYAAPDFDFRLPGVSSMSADTHKYGYASKGTSVVLYRGTKLRRFQYFLNTEWPGGLYFSPTLAGTRPGAALAACWAALVGIGANGYRDAAKLVLETGAAIRRGIEQIPDLHVLGDPLWVIAFASRSLDIYRVLDAMSERGWSLNGLQRPPAVHLCVTLRHAEPGVAERFLADLRASVEHVRATPGERQGLAPVYGMAGSFPVRGAVSELLGRYVDELYEP